MTASAIDISFIIVSWNAKRHLRNCLLSLREATRSFVCEILVIDNASTDGSPEMVAENFPEVELIRNTVNTGFAKANNQGLQKAKGSYYCLVNSDVEVFPDSLVILLDYVKAHPEIGLLGPKVLNTDRSIQISCRTQPSLRSSFFRALRLDTCFPHSSIFGAHEMTNWDHGETREVDILSGCFWLIRATSIRTVGMLDERFFMYGEDMDFCKRFHEAGWKVIFYPGAKIVHHGAASSANAPARFWVEMQRANLQYWEKHYGRMAMRAYHGCLLLHNLLRCTGFAIRCLLGTSNGPWWEKLEKHWRGLKWLVSPRTLTAMLRGIL